MMKKKKKKSTGKLEFIKFKIYNVEMFLNILFTKRKKLIVYLFIFLGIVFSIIHEKMGE